MKEWPLFLSAAMEMLEFFRQKNGLGKYKDVLVDGIVPAMPAHFATKPFKQNHTSLPKDYPCAAVYF